MLAKDRDPQNSFYNDLKEGGQSVEGQRLQLPAARTPSNDSKTCVLAKGHPGMDGMSYKKKWERVRDDFISK